MGMCGEKKYFGFANPASGRELALHTLRPVLGELQDIGRNEEDLTSRGGQPACPNLEWIKLIPGFARASDVPLEEDAQPRREFSLRGPAKEAARLFYHLEDIEEGDSVVIARVQVRSGGNKWQDLSVDGDCLDRDTQTRRTDVGGLDGIDEGSGRSDAAELFGIVAGRHGELGEGPGRLEAGPPGAGGIDGAAILGVDASVDASVGRPACARASPSYSAQEFEASSRTEGPAGAPRKLEAQAREFDCVAGVGPEAPALGKGPALPVQVFDEDRLTGAISVEKIGKNALYDRLGQL